MTITGLGVVGTQLYGNICAANRAANGLHKDNHNAGRIKLALVDGMEGGEGLIRDAKELHKEWSDVLCTLNTSVMEGKPLPAFAFVGGCWSVQVYLGEEDDVGGKTKAWIPLYPPGKQLDLASVFPDIEKALPTASISAKADRRDDPPALDKAEPVLKRKYIELEGVRYELTECAEPGKKARNHEVTAAFEALSSKSATRERDLLQAGAQFRATVLDTPLNDRYDLVTKYELAINEAAQALAELAQKIKDLGAVADK